MNLSGKMAEKYMFSSVFSSIFTFLFTFVAVSETSDQVSYCWHGDIESHRSLLNETCASGRLHPPDTRDSTLSTPSPLPPQNLTQVTSLPAVSVVMVTNCMVFQYIKHTELGLSDGFTTYDTSIFANYSCDYTGMCHGMDNGWHHNVTFNGMHGNVYCCDTNNCNNNVNGVLPKQRLCYEASNETEKHTGAVLPCMAFGAICARSTWIRPADGVKVSSYYCDNSFKCQSNGLPRKHSPCKMVRRGNESEELCCCIKNKCFLPPWPISDEPTPSNNTATMDTLQWVIAGVVILLTFCLGVAGGVALAVVRNRRKALRDNHMAMTYRRIAAEEGAPNGDEEHLIT